MYYGMIVDERVKGITYTQQPDRVRRLSETEVSFKTDTATHCLVLTKSGWRCSCQTFGLIAASAYPAYCAHVIAVERLLGFAGFAGANGQDSRNLPV